MSALVIVSLSMYVFAGAGQLVCLGSDIDCRNAQRAICEKEKHTSNLVLGNAMQITGHVKDQTGAGFESGYRVQLRSTKTGAILATSAIDDSGRFQFIDPPSQADRLILVRVGNDTLRQPGFKQPTDLRCGPNPECKLEIVMKVEPTDRAVDQCPVQ